MKKSKLLAVCLIGVLMAVGLVLASCGSNCSEHGDCETTGNTRGSFCDDDDCAVNKVWNGKSSSGQGVTTCDCKNR
jgi:hypothetical protein